MRSASGGMAAEVASSVMHLTLCAKVKPQHPAGTLVGLRYSRRMETEYREGSPVLAQMIKAYARGVSAAQFAVNRALNNRLMTRAIAGPRTSGGSTSMHHPFTDQDEACIGRLVPAPRRLATRIRVHRPGAANIAYPG